MTPVRLEPVATRSRVKLSTTEPLRSRYGICAGYTCMCCKQPYNSGICDVNTPVANVKCNVINDVKLFLTVAGYTVGNF